MLSGLALNKHKARQNHAQPGTNYSPQLSWNLSMYSTQCSENNEVFQSVLWEQPLLPALFEILYYFRWSFPQPQVTNVLSYMHWLVLTWKLKEGPSKFLELSFCAALLSSTVLQTLATSVLSDSAVCQRFHQALPVSPSLWCSRETLKAVSWSNHRTHLICFLSLRAQSFIAWCLEKQCFLYFVYFLLLLSCLNLLTIVSQKKTFDAFRKNIWIESLAF